MLDTLLLQSGAVIDDPLVSSSLCSGSVYYYAFGIIWQLYTFPRVSSSLDHLVKDCAVGCTTALSGFLVTKNLRQA